MSSIESDIEVEDNDIDDDVRDPDFIAEIADEEERQSSLEPGNIKKWFVSLSASLSIYCH